MGILVTNLLTARSRQMMNLMVLPQTRLRTLAQLRNLPLSKSEGMLRARGNPSCYPLTQLRHLKVMRRRSRPRIVPMERTKPAREPRPHRYLTSWFEMFLTFIGSPEVRCGNGAHTPRGRDTRWLETRTDTVDTAAMHQELRTGSCSRVVGR